MLIRNYQKLFYLLFLFALPSISYARGGYCSVHYGVCTSIFFVLTVFIWWLINFLWEDENCLVVFLIPVALYITLRFLVGLFVCAVGGL